MDIDGWLTNTVKSMNARTSVKVNGVGGRDFPVEVGVHQGSMLSPLLFIIVMEAILESTLVGCVVKVLRPTIQCTLCMKWVHKRCSGINRELRAEDAEVFKCKTCVKEGQGLNKSDAGCVESMMD